MRIRGELDTGASRTCIRETTAKTLMLQMSRWGRTIGVTDSVEDGGIRSRMLTAVVVIGDYFDDIVELVELPDDRIDTELLIGRDILNEIHVGFWGPDLTISFYQDRPD